MLSDCHGCSKCGNIFNASTWSKDVLKHHRGQKERDLVCTTCLQQGYSVGQYKEYPCKDCGKRYGSLKFDKQSIYNFNKEKTSHLVCEDCKTKLKCAACKVAFPKTAWTKAERDHNDRPDRKTGTKLVCKACRSAGYTPDDTDPYTCQHCQKEGGYKAFDPDLMHHYKVHGRQKLLCRTCFANLAEKTKELQKKLRKSKRVCNCFSLVHRSKCPLEPCYYGEKRWPGSDGHISAEDRDVLDNLRPPPDWWATARGHRRKGK